MSFAGRTVLITGASRGLGAELASAFAARGAFVALGYRVQEKKAQRVLDAIVASGGSGTLSRFDVTDRDAVSAAIDRLIADRGRLDVLVNNAALTRSAYFALDDADAWDEVVSVDLIGAANCMRAAARPMLAAGGGVVLNVGSISSERVRIGQSAYAAAKGGLIALTRALAAELGPRGIRVNAVIPGLLDTGMGQRMDSAARERLVDAIPLKRAGTAAEVTAAALFLASDDASYVHGQALVVDGGLCL